MHKRRKVSRPSELPATYFLPRRVSATEYVVEIFGLEIGYTSGTLPFRLFARTVIYADKEDFKGTKPIVNSSTALSLTVSPRELTVV